MELSWRVRVFDLMMPRKGDYKGDMPVTMLKCEFMATTQTQAKSRNWTSSLLPVVTDSSRWLPTAKLKNLFLSLGDLHGPPKESKFHRRDSLKGLLPYIRAVCAVGAAAHDGYSRSGFLSA